MTVEIWVEGFPVRLICGYGPQEYDKKERKESFWNYLNEETQKAKKDGAGLVLQMDGNLWAGKKIVKSDPKKQNQNGKLFENFLLKNPHLSVVNALPMCEGSITRVRHTKDHTEETILDFYVVCDQILPVVKSMKIDTKGEITLTRYKDKVVKSDHMMLKLELDLAFHEENKHERNEIFNVRNKTCQKVFCEFTSRENVFSDCFRSQENVDIQFSRWQRKLSKALHSCFKKIRIKKDQRKKPSKIDDLMGQKKSILRKKTLSTEEENEIDSIEKEITDEIADQEFQKLENIIGNLEADTNSNIWKEMRKAYPKNSIPLPTGVKNVKGKIITNPKEKKTVIIDHFKHRMRKRSIKDETKELEVLTKDIFNDRLRQARVNKCPPPLV